LNTTFAFALLNAGLTAQEEKLRENRHKRGFNEVTLDYAWRRLTEEVQELNMEINGTVILNHSDIRKEAADVANFAHMLILKCDQELKHAK